MGTCYSAAYMSQTLDQQRFTILEVTADWHEPYDTPPVFNAHVLPNAEENMMIDMLSLFSICAGTWRMDEQTDRRTELLYKYPGLFKVFRNAHDFYINICGFYRASAHWRAILI